MDDQDFSLLREPWILVLRPDGVQKEVSLLDALRQSHELRGLAGELPTQDVAVLRLLLAVLHSVFARYDSNGEFNPISTPREALGRWISLWDRGALPMGIIERYLQKYDNRFYLFPPEKSFFQVASINNAISLPLIFPPLPFPPRVV